MTGPRFRQIADEVRERIALGEFGDSGALDSEAELGRRYQASRTTVRKALDVLRAAGLVESRVGSGHFVTGGAVHQQLALGTFRHAGSAIAGRDVRRRVVTFGWSAPPPAIAATLRVQATADALCARTVRTVDGAPLDAATEWIPGATAARLSRADLAEPGAWHALQRQGVTIATVTQTITAGLATDSDADLLDVAPGSALLLIRRLALDPDDTPVALADHRYLASRFSLEVEFHGAWSDLPAGLRETTIVPLKDLEDPANPENPEDPGNIGDTP